MGPANLTVHELGPREAVVYRIFFVLMWAGAFGVPLWAVGRPAILPGIGISIGILIIAWLLGWKLGFGGSMIIVRPNEKKEE